MILTVAPTTNTRVAAVSRLIIKVSPASPQYKGEAAWGQQTVGGKPTRLNIFLPELTEDLNFNQEWIEYNLEIEMEMP